MAKKLKTDGSPAPQQSAETAAVDSVPEAAGPRPRYTTIQEGAKPMIVTRDDLPKVQLRDRFINQPEAIRCFILLHGPGAFGSKYKVIEVAEHGDESGEPGSP